MDESDKYSIEQVSAPVLSHFNQQAQGPFDLDLSSQSANRQRMVDIYLRYTLRGRYGESRNIRTHLSASGVLTIQMD